MKKTTLTTIILAAVMLAPASVCAAAPAVPASAPAAVATVASTTETSTTKMVKVNGVEMTQAQARLVILQNIKNHRQMTPEEMAAYVNNLAANEGNK